MGNEDTYKTGDRFREIADRLYEGNKSELARSMGMQPSSFSKYLQGSRRPGAKILTKLSQLGVNMNWFLSGKGPMMRSGPTELRQPLPLKSDHSMNTSIQGPNGPLQRIPFVRVTADDAGSPVLEEVGTAEWMSQSFIRQAYGIPPEELKAFRKSGDSMAETIRPGERLRGTLWKGESLTDGAVYLVYTPKGVILRRLYLRDDTITMTADNPEVPNRATGTEKWPGVFRPVARILEVVRSL